MRWRSLKASEFAANSDRSRRGSALRHEGQIKTSLASSLDGRARISN
jgi:hypothetical protein